MKNEEFATADEKKEKKLKNDGKRCNLSLF